jgi:hypothetical protein
MGAEITVAHGSAWLIEDPRWIQALVIDRPSPAYKLTWRIDDLIAELVVSTTIAQADAIRIADQAHFDRGDLALGWVPQDLEHVDVATGVGECPSSFVLLHREQLDNEHDSRIVVRTRVVPPGVPMAAWTPTSTIALRPGADALMFTDSHTVAMWWRPSTNLIVEIEGRDATLDDVRAIAQGLRALPESEWEQQRVRFVRHAATDDLDADDGLLPTEWDDDGLRPRSWARYDEAAVDRDEVLATGELDGAPWQLRLRRQRPFGLAADLPPFLLLASSTSDRIRDGVPRSGGESRLVLGAVSRWA